MTSNNDIDEDPRPDRPDLHPAMPGYRLAWENYWHRLAEWKATRAERFLLAAGTPFPAAADQDGEDQYFCSCGHPIELCESHICGVLEL